MNEPVVGREVLSDFERASRLEWLVTNGLGGYASGTVANSGSRRYHGLLVAATRPGVDRIVTVSQLEETVRTPRGGGALSSHAWPGVVDPRGFLNIDAFVRGRRPTWRFRIDDLFLEKSIFMPQGRNTTLVEYRHLSGPPCELTLRPFVVMREHHGLTHEDPSFDTTVEALPAGARLQPRAALPALSILASGGRFVSWPVWYRDFEYAFELERGLDFREDAFSPGPIVLQLAAGERSVLAVSIEAGDDAPPSGPALASWFDAAAAAEACRLDRLEERAPSVALARAADQFWIDAHGGTSVIAGYPWFTDWGRDTMISLRGLALATGRDDLFERALTTFARFVRDGLVPNRFVEGTGEADYGSVDAALWFAVAAEAYVARTGDTKLLEKTLAPTLGAILDRFVEGTRFGIGADDEALLACGTGDTALTWMDARVDGRPVTPRAGRPVEINALWYNAWATRAAFAHKLGDKTQAQAAEAHAQRIEESFAAAFWTPARGWLADNVDVVGPDPSLRPNALYAIGLPHPVTTGEPARLTLEAIESRLLAPFGLRTLAPGDARYRGTYVSDPRVRDAGYHNGAVWPFLLGAWADAHFAVRGRSDATREHARRVLAPLAHHLDHDACLGQVSEIFDGDLPSVPRGACAQAWSVAELARVWIGEGLGASN